MSGHNGLGLPSPPAGISNPLTSFLGHGSAGGLSLPPNQPGPFPNPYPEGVPTPEEQASLTREDLLVVEELVGNAIASRQEWMRGVMADPRRNLDKECGFPEPGQVVDTIYTNLYDRDPLAARAVQVMARESWQVSPLVYETEDAEEVTAFETAWDELGKNLRAEKSYHAQEEGSLVWSILEEADVLSGIGHYAVILLGLDDGKPLSEPVDGWEEMFSVPIDASNGGSGSKKSGKKANLKSDQDPVGRGGVSAQYGTYGGTYNSEDEAAYNDAYLRAQLILNGREDQIPDGGFPRQDAADDPTSNEKANKAYPEGPYSLTVNEKKTKGRKLLYMSVFPESLAPISTYESNPTSPRFMQPTMYDVTFNDPRSAAGGVSAGPWAMTKQVHWTRIVPIADTHHQATSSKVFAAPRLEPILNVVLSAQKVWSAGSEGYWQSCFTTLSFETHPQLGGDVKVDKTKLKAMMYEVRNRLQRDLFTSGMAVKSLAPNVVDMTPFVETLINLICIKLGIPVRIFKGSERGELASTQDDAAWNDRVKQRQGAYLTPKVVVPLIDRLINVGVLPKPKAKLSKPEAVAAEEGKDAEESVPAEEVEEKADEKAAVANVKDQPRDEIGRWTSTRGGTAKTVEELRGLLTPQGEYGRLGTKAIGPVTLVGFRVGETADKFGRGTFFSGDQEGADAYASLHPTHKTLRHEIDLDNALLAGHQNDVSMEFFGKGYGEMHQKLGGGVEGGRKFDVKVAKEAKKRGYDGIIYLRPAAPANTEIAVIGRGGKSKKVVVNVGFPPPQKSPKPTGGEPDQVTDVAAKAQGETPAVPPKGAGRPEPVEREEEPGYKVEWPDIASQSKAEKADVAGKVTTALAAYTGPGAVKDLIAPFDYLTRVLDWTEEEAHATLDNTEEHKAATEQADVAKQQDAIKKGLVADPVKEQDAKIEALKSGKALAPPVPGKPGQPAVAGAPPAKTPGFPAGRGPTLNFDPNQARDDDGQWVAVSKHSRKASEAVEKIPTLTGDADTIASNHRDIMTKIRSLTHQAAVNSREPETRMDAVRNHAEAIDEHDRAIWNLQSGAENAKSWAKKEDIAHVKSIVKLHRAAKTLHVKAIKELAVHGSPLTNEEGLPAGRGPTLNEGDGLPDGWDDVLNAEQPRVPAGSSDGGQFASAGRQVAPSTILEAVSRFGQVTKDVSGVDPGQAGRADIPMKGKRTIMVGLLPEWDAKKGDFNYSARIDFNDREMKDTENRREAQAGSIEMVRKVKELARAYHAAGFSLTVGAADDRRKDAYEAMLRKMGMTLIRDGKDQVWNVSFLPEVTTNDARVVIKDLAAYLHGLIDDVTLEDARNVARAVKLGVEDGLSDDQVANVLRKVLPEEDFNEYRTRLIATTEMTRARGELLLMNARDAGEAEVRFTAHPDCCDECQKLNGRTYSVGKLVTNEDATTNTKVKPASGVIPVHPGCRCRWDRGADPLTGNKFDPGQKRGEDGRWTTVGAMAGYEKRLPKAEAMQKTTDAAKSVFGDKAVTSTDRGLTIRTPTHSISMSVGGDDWATFHTSFKFSAAAEPMFLESSSKESGATPVGKDLRAGSLSMIRDLGRLVEAINPAGVRIAYDAVPSKDKTDRRGRLYEKLMTSAGYVRSQADTWVPGWMVGADSPTGNVRWDDVSADEVWAAFGSEDWGADPLTGNAEQPRDELGRWTTGGSFHRVAGSTPEETARNIRALPPAAESHIWTATSEGREIGNLFTTVPQSQRDAAFKDIMKWANRDETHLEEFKLSPAQLSRMVTPQPNLKEENLVNWVKSAGELPGGADAFYHQGTLYLRDGNHRAAAAVLTGRAMTVRVVHRKDDDFAPEKLAPTANAVKHEPAGSSKGGQFVSQGAGTPTKADAPHPKAGHAEPKAAEPYAPAPKAEGAHVKPAAAQPKAAEGKKFATPQEIEGGKSKEIKPGVSKVTTASGDAYAVKQRGTADKGGDAEKQVSDMARVAGVNVPRTEKQTVNGKPAVVTEWAEGKDMSKMTGEERKKFLATVPKEQIDKHVMFDYLLGHGDTHNGNFIAGADGSLVAIDKELWGHNGGHGKGTKFDIPQFLADATPKGHDTLHTFDRKHVDDMIAAGEKMATTPGINPKDAAGIRNRLAVLTEFAKRPDEELTAGELWSAGQRGVPGGSGFLGGVRRMFGGG